jgi:hypothetical protein
VTFPLSLLLLSLQNPAHATEVTFDGHYRARGDLYNSLSLSTENSQAEGLSSFVDHRFRLQPTWHISHAIRIQTQLDLLRGVTWGDEAIAPVDPVTGDTLSTMLGESVQSPTTEDGGATPGNLSVTRLWTEIDTRYGMVQFGRMPLHWGAGMVWNAGNRAEDEYGDTTDRVQFTAKTGMVYLTGALESRVENFVGEEDDFNGYTAQILYKTEQGGIGSTHNLRMQRGEDAFRLYTGDIWAAAQLGSAEIEAEFAATLGRGDLDTGENNLSIASFGGLLRGGFTGNGLRLGLAVGFASGDADPDDSSIKTFSYDPDFNIGLMLFEEAMPILESSVMNDTNEGRNSSAVRLGEGVSNAIFLRPRVGYQLTDNASADLYLLSANQAKPPEDYEDQKGYGTEIGAHFSYRPMAHVDLSGTTAVFLPGTYFSEYEHETLGADFNSPAFGARIIAAVQF